MNRLLVSICLVAALISGRGTTWAAGRRPAPKKVEQLTERGKQLEAKYAALLAALCADIKKDLPAISEEKLAALQKAHAEAQVSQKNADSAIKDAGEVSKINAVIANWKKFRVRPAEKKLANAKADLDAAKTDADRQAAKSEIAKQEAELSKFDRLIRENEAKLEKAKTTQPQLVKERDAAVLERDRLLAAENKAAKAALGDLESFLSSDKLDVKLVKATVIAAATPNGLAAFAQQGREREELVEKLLADASLMKEMLAGGGASYGHYGQAMDIYTAIQKESPKAGDRTGVLHRLALATSLEFATPFHKPSRKESAPRKPDDSDAIAVPDEPGAGDPVRRYLSYEKAYLNHELDPAFKTLSVWEYRMVVNGEGDEKALAWGREMIRNYRPDLVRMANYGWRYSGLVKSDVTYGSKNVKNDRPELSFFQNILKDGGVCGRRAFFGRFILRANGIPVWGVTQFKHAALSHWTPKGWVMNLGAGFNHSWWDKGERHVSGKEFLLETQARRHEQDYWKVLRAQWVSRILGEQAYNDRDNTPGGTWSRMGHYLTVMIASREVELAPLGKELAEANARDEDEEVEQAAITPADRKSVVGEDGTITIPSAAKGKSSGWGHAMKSFGEGMQLVGAAGFATEYEFEAPREGKYTLTTRVVTVQENKKISFSVNDGQALDVPVPYTIGMWQHTKPVEVTLAKGRNVLRFGIVGPGRLAIKDFTLKPVK